MTDAVMGLLHELMSSPWVYVALFALSALDGFLPVVPSESVVITAGVFAASGQPELPLVVAAAAAGAFLGDHVSYWIGRLAGPRLQARARAGTRRRAALDRAARVLESRGGLVIVAARYVPGGRTAVTLTAGTVGYRARAFAGYAAVAALTWGIYSALVGYLGGMAFETDPLRGLLLGLGLALTLTAAVELGRYLRAGRAGRVSSGTAG